MNRFCKKNTAKFLPPFWFVLLREFALPFSYVKFHWFFCCYKLLHCCCRFLHSCLGINCTENDQTLGKLGEHSIMASASTKTYPFFVLSQLLACSITRMSKLQTHGKIGTLSVLCICAARVVIASYLKVSTHENLFLQTSPCQVLFKAYLSWPYLCPPT